MRRINIGELERITEMKMHTIRAWETRYNLISPCRQGVIRVYSNEELGLFLNIALLNQCGHKISVINKLGPEGVKEKASQITNPQARLQKMVFELITAMYRIDVITFENILDNGLRDWGCTLMLNRVIVPFLEKTNILSFKDSSTEVHFVVRVIRKKIIVCIEQLPAAESGINALLFLPKGSYYDLVLLYMAWQLKTKGIKVLFFGTNISTQNLEEALREKQPDLLYTYSFDARQFDFKLYSELLHEFKQLNCYVATASTELPASHGSNIRLTSYKNIPINP